MLVDEDIIEFDTDGMANGSVIGRPERTPSLGYIKDRKRFTDFGASARRADGKPDGGDVLELRVRVNAAQDGMSKSETMRQIAREFISEAEATLKQAANKGEQPPPWVQLVMSPTGWEYYHQLRQHNEAGSPDEASQTNTEPAPHTGGIVGPCLKILGQAAPLQRKQAQDTPEASANEKVSLLELELIRDYGRAHEWPALVLDGEEVIPAGRADWLDFVWLSHKHEQQHCVYEWVRSQSTLS